LLSWTCPWKVRGRPLAPIAVLTGNPWLLQLAGDRDTIRAFAAACEIRSCAGCFLTSSRQLRVRRRSCRARCGVFCVRNSAARVMSCVVSAPRIADSRFGREVSEAGPCAIATWVVPPPTKASSEIPRCTRGPFSSIGKSNGGTPDDRRTRSRRQPSKFGEMSAAALSAPPHSLT
jgi:hypothetical protein